MTVAKEITTEIAVAGNNPVPYITLKFGFGDSIEIGAEVAEWLGESLDLTNGVGSIIAGFGRSLTKHGHVELIAKILRRTFRDGVKLDTREALASAYEGNLGEMVQAIAWVVEVNWSDFFAEGVRPLMESKVLAPAMAMLREQQSASWLAGTSGGKDGSSSSGSASRTRKSSSGGRSRKSTKR
ncbi:MAG: phage tail assembly chaperone [Solirubrobacterales bacterium]